jgi:hypothetical protein
MTMFAASTVPNRRRLLVAAAAVGGLGLLAAGYAYARPSLEAQDPVAITTQKGEPPAKLIVDPPLHGPLAKGVAIVQFRTENLQIVPVFGPAAAAVSPRIGHLHVTVDDTAWHWGHTSRDPVIVAPLPPGRHQILLELADANHNVLAKEVVKFEVPRQ